MKVSRIGYLAMVAAIPLVQMKADAMFGEFRDQQEVLYLWSGRHIRALSPGFESVMADLYWLRTVQYFGGRRSNPGKNFDLLLPLIQITTTLDERFEIAYRYGAIFLSEPRPLGAGNPTAGIALLERGSQAIPASWRLRQDLGFFHFVFLHDARRASEVLLDASHIAGAPFWLRSMAASLLIKGGERTASRRIWTEMYEQSENGAMKSTARVHLQMLDALDLADRLTARVEDFRHRFGRVPASLDELQAVGLIRGVPTDPSGVPFEYDPASGRATVSRTSGLWRPE